MTDIQKIIQLTKQGIEAISNALQMYAVKLDQPIPWSMYIDKSTEMGRYTKEFTNGSGILVSEIATTLTIARDSYNSIIQNIIEWCGQVKQLLTEYRQLFDQHSADTYARQRTILVQVLDIVSNQMANVQNLVLRISISFNNAARLLAILDNRLTAEFSPNDAYYQDQMHKLEQHLSTAAALGPYGLSITVEDVTPALDSLMRQNKDYFDDLQALVNQSDSDTGPVVDQLQHEIQRIGIVRTQFLETNTTVSLDELRLLRGIVLGPVTDLIAQIDAYVNRHSNVDQ